MPDSNPPSYPSGFLARDEFLRKKEEYYAYHANAPLPTLPKAPRPASPPKGWTKPPYNTPEYNE